MNAVHDTLPTKVGDVQMNNFFASYVVIISSCSV